MEAEDLEALLAAAIAGPTSVPDVLLADALRTCRDGLPSQPASPLAQRLDVGGARHDRDRRMGMTLNTFLKSVGRARNLLAECLARAGVDLAPYVQREDHRPAAKG